MGENATFIGITLHANVEHRSSRQLSLAHVERKRRIQISNHVMGVLMLKTFHKQILQTHFWWFRCEENRKSNL